MLTNNQRMRLSDDLELICTGCHRRRPNRPRTGTGYAAVWVEGHSANPIWSDHAEGQRQFFIS